MTILLRILVLDEGVDQGSDTTHDRTTDGHTNDLAQMATRILGVPPSGKWQYIYDDRPPHWHHWGRVVVRSGFKKIWSLRLT
jgi:hypothetical protein